MSNATLSNEVLSVNSIYEDSALEILDEKGLVCSLKLPNPQGPLSSGEGSTRKGEATRLVEVVKEVLSKVYKKGDPCIFEEPQAKEPHNEATEGPDDADGEEGGSQASITVIQGDNARQSSTLRNSAGMNKAVYNALIRSHHITSRRKIAALKKAADNLNCFALLRSGGSPGIMYVEGNEEDVRAWVGEVQRLRYKDFQFASKPSPLCGDGSRRWGEGEVRGKGLSEVGSVREFGAVMEERGVLEWWRERMGYAKD